MSQKVLCVSAGSVARLYYENPIGWFCSEPDELEAFESLVRTSAYFVEREKAESDPGFVQLISYCVIASHSKILCLERSAGSSRPELKSKWTSMFGGHVDESDRLESAWQAVIDGVKREIREELGIHINGTTPKFAGLAIDPTNHTGRLHLGVIFYYAMEDCGVHLTNELDLSEFNVSAKVIHFFDPREIFRIRDQFDPWSSLFLKSSFARDHFSQELPGVAPLPLLHAY